MNTPGAWPLADHPFRGTEDPALASLVALDPGPGRLIEAQAFAGRPLGPIGKGRGPEDAVFPRINWRIEGLHRTGGRLPSGGTLALAYVQVLRHRDRLHGGGDAPGPGDLAALASDVPDRGIRRRVRSALAALATLRYLTPTGEHAVLSQNPTKLLPGAVFAPFGVEAHLSAVDSVPTGALPLLRLLMWLRHQGRRSIFASEALERMGSEQADPRPARVRQVLQRPSLALVRTGVLSEEPALERIGRDTEIRIQLGPSTSLTRAELLILRQAVRIGIRPDASRSLIVQNPAHLLRVLAALCTGILRPTKSMAAAAYTYASRGLDLPRHGNRADILTEPPPRGAPLDLHYLHWCRRERESRGVVRTSGEVRTILPWIQWDEEPQWVEEGARMILAHDELDLIGLEEWMRQLPGDFRP